MDPENNEEMEEFIFVMTSLADEMGANLDTKRTLLDVKYEGLIEYDLADIKKGISWIVKNRVQTFPAMPRVKEIIDAIDKVSGNTLLNTTANSECDLVIGFLKKHGGTMSLPESHPITNYLMTRVWPWFHWASSVKEKDLVWFRKDFVARFEQIEKDGLEELSSQIGHQFLKPIGLDIKRIS